MLICGLLIVFIVASTANFLWGDPWRVLAAAAVVGVSPLVLGPTALAWYDIWPTLLTIATVALFVRKRFTAAFALLGVAVATKFFALVLLPILLLQAARTVGWRRTLVPAIGFLATTVLFFGSAAALSVKGARYPFTYLIDRPIEIESTAGSIIGLFHLAGWWGIDVNNSYGSTNFEGRRAAVLGLVIAVVGGVALLALWWRSALVRLPPETLIAWCTAAIAIALASSKVFSPQYLVWLVPFVALTLRRTALLALTIAHRSHPHLVPRALVPLQQHPTALRTRGAPRSRRRAPRHLLDLRCSHLESEQTAGNGVAAVPRPAPQHLHPRESLGRVGSLQATLSGLGALCTELDVRCRGANLTGVGGCRSIRSSEEGS